MIEILLAEDHHVVRAALVALLELEPDMRIVAEVGRGDAVLAEALRTRPQVAVIDIDMPGLDGLDAAAQVMAQVAGCRTLILTALGRPGTLRGRSRQTLVASCRRTPRRPNWSRRSARSIWDAACSTPNWPRSRGTPHRGRR